MTKTASTAGFVPSRVSAHHVCTKCYCLVPWELLGAHLQWHASLEAEGREVPDAD